MLHLEERESALARGARIYGEVLEHRSGARVPAAPREDGLASRTGHLFAALAPLELSLALLDEETDEVRCEERGPSGEWVTLAARRAAPRGIA
jgi:hypothetical protein